MTALCLGVVLVLAADPIESRADEFAKAVQQIHETIQERSIVRPSPRLLTELSLRGLYKAHGHDLPDDLAKRLKDEKATPAELHAMLREGYRGLAKCRELDVNKAVDDAILHTLAAFDPYASWKPANTDFSDCDLNHDLSSIGVVLRLDGKTKLPVVVTPIKDGPAYRAGIRAGDVITYVTSMRYVTTNSDRQMETMATAGVELPTVYLMLRGKRDSKVLLDIQREGVKEPLRLEMARGPVQIDTIHGWRRKDDDSWNYVLDGEKKIGYLHVVRFGQGTPKELAKVLDELDTQGIRNLVLDLRFCEGGFLFGMIGAAEQFLVKDERLFKVQYGEFPTEDHTCKEGKRRNHLKVVCLVNGDTSSAAEIFAAALQDHRRAILVGERTSGKGSVQNIEPLLEHDFCFTVAVFLRPSGKKLDRIRLAGHDADEWGVTPDAENVVRLSPNEQDALKEHLKQVSLIPRRDIPVKEPPTIEDRQLQRALDILTQR